MPVQIHLERYKCDHCGKEYETIERATNCELGHEIIYIGITRSDLKALWSFLVTGRPEHITPSLERTLRKYNKIIGRV